MPSETLKPCPFCGSNHIAPSGVEPSKVYCAECRATVPLIWWNRRTEPAAHEDVEALVADVEYALLVVRTALGDARLNDMRVAPLSASDLMWLDSWLTRLAALRTPQDEVRAALTEAQRKVRPIAESRGAIVGEPGNWIAPYHECCGNSLDWRENGYAIEATCPATGEYHAFVLVRTPQDDVEGR